MKYCSKCGKEIKEENFCPHCGESQNNIQNTIPQKKKKYKGSIIMGIVYIMGIWAFLTLLSSCQIKIVPQ